MSDDPCRSLAAVRDVVERARRAGARPVLVRSRPGGGADVVVRTAASVLEQSGHEVLAVEVEALGARDQLELRGRRRSHVVLLGSSADHLPPDTMGLIDYLRPQLVDVDPVDIDTTRRLVDSVVGDGRCTDELAAAVHVATAGRLGDVIDVAAHVRECGAGGQAVLDLGRFAPTRARLGGGPADVDRVVLAWAVATAEHVPAAAALFAPGDGLRPVDAVAIRDALDGGSRPEVLRMLCDDAAGVAATLSPDEKVTVGSWWCELADAGQGAVLLTGPELIALFAGVMTAVELNRWGPAGRLAERLWRTTHVAEAAAGVAAALARSAPSPLLDELIAAHPTDDLVLATAGFTRALWQFYVDHHPDDARSTLEGLASMLVEHRYMGVDGLATVDLHTGDPDAVERRVRDRPPSPDGHTSFSINALALADLVRARHGLVLERLDDEVERQLHPGMNLTADRYRFMRSLVLARSGLGDDPERSELAAELARQYEGALRRGDDWNLGWTAWTAGQLDARSGRSAVARRRLRTAVVAYRRSHRSGFADWPLATLVATMALHTGEPATDADVEALTSPVHAVAAERSDALLSLALHARSCGAPQREVAAILREAMHVARRQREVMTGHLVAIEQWLLGVPVDATPDDDLADGPVLAACRRVIEGSTSGVIDDVERGACELVELGWTVLGARVLADVAERVRRDDLRRSTRLFQTVRLLVDGFDEPFRPWVMASVDLPMLSSRELEVARGISSGATRDELAASLGVSRRTIDSHLQRAYAKLGISSRAELRDWLDR